MTFTDEDIAWAKKKVFDNANPKATQATIVRSKLLALVARLEAAEICQEKCAHINSNSTGCPYCEAWRKSAGKHL
jgi:hypothetical protein